MKVIIELTEFGVKAAIALCMSGCGDEFHEAIANGIVLDDDVKLVDANAAIKYIDDFCKLEKIDIRDSMLMKQTRTFIRNLPPIIKQNKENKDADSD